MKRLGDGSILPHNFMTEPVKGAKHFLHNNLALRSGMVTDIIYPDDDSSLSKQVIEYNVAVAQYEARGGVNISMIRNCKVNNIFGSQNNNLTYTLKPGTKDDKGIYQKTSIVTILCINGITDAGSAVIIGGLANDDGPSYTSEDGQFYDFNFNGINWNINKDGEYTVTFNSPLDDDGNPTNKDAQGTEIKIDKNGVVKISDNEGQFWSIDRTSKISTWSNGNESIIIDKGNKAVSLTSSGTMDSSSQKAMTMSSQDAVSVSSQNDMSLKSGSNTAIEASANMNMKAGSAWSVNVSGNANLQIGGDLTMIAGGNAQMMGTLNMLGLGDLPIALVGISQAIGTGNLGAPVVSTILNGSFTCFAGT